MRDGFIIHGNTIRMLTRLDEASVGMFMKLLIEYYRNGRLPKGMDEIAEENLPVSIALEFATEIMAADFKAERLSESRSKAGKSGANRRWKNGKSIANAWQNDSKPIANLWQTDSKVIANDGFAIAEENEENEEEKVEPKEEAKEVKEDIYKEKVIAKAITEEKVDPKHRYGEYKHVLLSDKELEKLNADYGIDKTAYAIKWFDAYIEEKGYKCKSYSLAMRRWVFDAIERDKKPPVSRSGTTKPNWNIEKRDYDMEDLEAQLLRRSL